MGTIGKRRVRFVVVGAGNIAQVAVLPAFAHAENAELVGLVSGDPAKRAELGKRFDVAHVGDYEQFEAVLRASRADAVYVCTPNSEHRRFTERAAAAKVHVLCEKPMAPTVADCHAMIDACRANGVQLMIAYRLHFDETTLRAIELVRSGKIGEPRIFTASFTQDTRPGDIRTRYETGGGAMFDLGVYPVNAARYLFGEEPNEVMAMSVEGRDPRFHDVAEATTAILRFPGGRLAQLSVSLGAAPTSSYRIIGTEGDIRLEPGFGYTSGIKQHITIGGETKEHQAAASDQFAPEITTFADAVLRGQEPEPSGLEGLADLRVVEAILESARTRRAVRLEPFLKSQRPTRAQAQVVPPVEEQHPVNAPSPSVK